MNGERASSVKRETIVTAGLDTCNDAMTLSPALRMAGLNAGKSEGSQSSGAPRLGDVTEASWPYGTATPPSSLRPVIKCKV
jgi:hypothetical protein